METENNFLYILKNEIPELKKPSFKIPGILPHQRTGFSSFQVVHCFLQSSPENTITVFLLVYVILNVNNNRAGKFLSVEVEKLTPPPPWQLEEFP